MLDRPCKDIIALKRRLRQLVRHFQRAQQWLRAANRGARAAITPRRFGWGRCVAIWFAIAGPLIITHSSAGQIRLPVADQNQPVVVTADAASHWQEGAVEVWLLRGRCNIRQGRMLAQSQEAVLWIERSQWPGRLPNKLITYLEGNVVIDCEHAGGAHPATGRRADTVRGGNWLGRFYSNPPVQMQLPVPVAAPQAPPAIYQRAVAARWNPVPAVRPARFNQDRPTYPHDDSPPPMGRRIRVFPRTSVPVQARWFPDPATNEQIAVIDSGVNILIDGLGELGSVDVATDRLVIWTSGVEAPDLSGGAVQGRETPLEIYLEGHIVFRQGDRVIYAKRMYYNATTEQGVVLDAEAVTPAADYEGLLRLKADVLQQLDRNNFEAFGASVTSSRIGVPRYWLQSEHITFQDIQQPWINPYTGQAELDPATGDVQIDHSLFAASRNNFIYMGGVPVFYWPRLATDLTQPNFYIDRISFGNDSVFGTQVLTDWNMYQILGIQNPPSGTKWTAAVDFLSDRGLGMGTLLRYDRSDVFGATAPFLGFMDAWGIHDGGRDNLGLGRRSLDPEEDLRGRVRAQHRQQLGLGFDLFAEVGLISDRNFLEQYYEEEWDQEKDQTTGIHLKRVQGNQSLTFSGDVHLNDFFTQTEGARVDHFTLGHALFHSPITWYEHSHVGFARLETANPSANPVDDPSSPLPWETGAGGVQYDDREGLVAASRQELDWPFNLGPVKVVPYAVGEASHWGQDRFGDELTRLYGQAGVRASLPMWKVNRSVHSLLLNVNGLAHKVVFDADLFWAESNRDFTRLPLYNPLQDDSIEHFQRRFISLDYGGVLPTPYDDRFYALRTGLAGAVTAPTTEIADDLVVLRTGVRQRWQTKRGHPGQQHIIDWITLDAHASLFPKPNRDNFGENVGLLDYDFRWHLGDRLTLLSDGFLDFFDDGLYKYTVGMQLTRPARGSFYIGYRALDGRFTSNVLSVATTYRMSHKWIATIGSSVDLADVGNIGQRGAFTRVGESFLVTVGFNIDASRDQFGVQMNLEPRFLSASNRGPIAGRLVPPVGTFGLE